MSREKLKAGIDLGFSDVKVYSLIKKNKIIENNFKMPTAISYAKSSVLDEGKDSLFKQKEIYSFQGKEYHVGKEAVSDSFSTRSIEFLQKYTTLLLHSVIDFKQYDAELGLGLPLSFYTKQNCSVLKESVYNTPVNGKTFQGNINIFPQGVGVLLDYMLDINKKGSEPFVEQIGDRHKQNGLILDIGYNTIDIVYFNKGSADRDYSDMFERYGLSKPLEILGEYLQSKFGITLNEQEIRDIFLEGHLKIYGQKKDLSEVIRDIVEKYSDEIMNLVRSKWDNLLKKSDTLILAGGGSHYLEKYMPEKYQGMLHVPKKAEFANARGFLKGIL